MKLLLLDFERSRIHLLHNVDSDYCDEPLLKELGYNVEMVQYMYLDDNFTFEDIEQFDVKKKLTLVEHQD